MKKILLFIGSAILCGFSVQAQTFHEVSNGETLSFAQESINSNDWVTYSTSNYASRTKCVKAGENIPNLSKSDRFVTVTVSGCESFEISVDGNGSRHLSVKIDNNEAESLLCGNNCNSYTYQTNNTGNCTLVFGGVDGSVYLSSITFSTPASPLAAKFTVAGEEMEINNETKTITGTVAADVDLSTATPEVTLGGSAASYTFDGNYNGGTLEVSSDAGETTTYTVTVTNRAADSQAPTVTETNITATEFAVDEAIVLTFDEPIVLAQVEGVALQVNGAAVEAAVTVEEDVKLKIAPAARLLSNADYTLTIANGAVTDIEGNSDTYEYTFKTVAKVLSATYVPAANEEYFHAAKIEFSTPVAAVEGETILVGATVESAINAQIDIKGNALYVLNVPEGENMNVWVPTTAISSIYGDTFNEDPANPGYGIVATMNQGSNAFRIGYNAPVNEFYILPEWIGGTAGVAVQRDYAGTDVTAVGAIRAGANDSLIVEVPSACDIAFSVSATGGRNFKVTDEADNELASVTGYKKGSPAILTVQMTKAGKAYLFTPGATGGFTVQAIAINTATAVEKTEVKSAVRYANLIIVNPAAEAVEVYNTTGAKVAASNGDIDMQSMPKGVYIVRTAKKAMKIVR